MAFPSLFLATMELFKRKWIGIRILNHARIAFIIKLKRTKNSKNTNK